MYETAEKRERVILVGVSLADRMSWRSWPAPPVPCALGASCRKGSRCIRPLTLAEGRQENSKI